MLIIVSRLTMRNLRQIRLKKETVVRRCFPRPAEISVVCARHSNIGKYEERRIRTGRDARPRMGQGTVEAAGWRLHGRLLPLQSEKRPGEHRALHQGALQVAHTMAWREVRCSQ